MLWKVALHPARRSASFGQQTSGNEAVGWSNLSENDVLSQNMVTVGMEEKVWIKTIKKFEGLKMMFIFIINTSITIT